MIITMIFIHTYLNFLDVDLPETLHFSVSPSAGNIGSVLSNWVDSTVHSKEQTD